MSAPACQPAVAVAPRKRRRRAPATGAAEDCFTCRARQAKCDRRRPYCSQCLGMGKECSGYRTTLTWGVGVASRGKLRGMSLPVPKSPKSPPTRSTRERAQTIAHAKPATATAPSAPSPPSREPVASPGLHDYPRWGLPVFADALSRPPRPPAKPLHRLHTSLAAAYDDTGLSTSTGPLSSYSDSVLGDYPSPSEFPGTPDDFTFADPMMQSYTDHYLHPHTPMSSTESLVFHDPPRSYPIICEDLSSSIGSDQSLPDFADMNPRTKLHIATLATQISFSYSRGKQIPQDSAPEEIHGLSPDAVVEPVPRALFALQTRSLSPRMQFLLDYYDKAICPVLVAYDGPSNPYRMHVIHLAMASPGLQNAIAALSINNIRMRQNTEVKFLALGKGQRISDQALLPESVYSRLTAEEIREMHGEPSSEELHYKATSIQLLNQQLADADRAMDDSVLATLLILCLFHVCDSGFSKFRTQLAGVQKLLSMRDRSVQSGFIGWIDMFFTWFDVMTSTVNDRETQVKGDALDMLDLSTNLGALEHLAGCEGRLFKLIARLGRLNLLSQNRPVSARSDDAPWPSPPYNRRAADYYSMHGHDRIDGNGWGRPLGSELADQTQNPLHLADDQRHEFWAEWHEIRDRLQQWELEPPAPCDAGTYAMPAGGLRDRLHISESFRYSALLYTERLAHPSLAPGAPNFQNLVAQVLFHMAQIGVGSGVNKFLLWPLFLTGTECVDATHRALVRRRCVEIQRESGFFNNLSGLEVLERTWREDDAGRGNETEAEVRGVGRQAFRWRKAMDRVDGEYMLI